MKMLELGCGNQPALYLGGELFEHGDVDYTAVDIALPTELLNDPSRKFIQADITSMAFFDDATFEHVLMRNFFGQFCDGTISPQIADRVINDGIHEAYRVLKPLGRIAVVEENTPMPADDIQFFLEKYEFRVVETEAMTYGIDNLHTDSSWRRLRSRYHADTPVQTAPDDWLGEPHVVVAAK